MEGTHIVTSRNDPDDNAVQIVEYFASWNSHHLKAFSPQERISRGIAVGLVATIMTFSINLDN